jgi:hypothetical protein
MAARLCCPTSNATAWQETWPKQKAGDAGFLFGVSDPKWGD